MSSQATIEVTEEASKSVVEPGEPSRGEGQPEESGESVTGEADTGTWAGENSDGVPGVVEKVVQNPQSGASGGPSA